MVKEETTIFFLFNSSKGNCEWAFTGVYCRGNNDERKKLGRELEECKKKSGEN